MAGPVLSALKYVIIRYKKAASERKLGRRVNPARTQTTQCAHDAALPHQRQAGPRARSVRKVQALRCQQKARKELTTTLGISVVEGQEPT